MSTLISNEISAKKLRVIEFALPINKKLLTTK
jgi:hypothetical protein